MMSGFFLIIDIVVVIYLLALSIISLLRQGYKKSANRFFALFNLFVVFWVSSNFISSEANIPGYISFVAGCIAAAAGFGSTILFCGFIVKLAGNERLNKIFDKLSIPLWVLCAISATPLVVSGIEWRGDFCMISFGPLIWLYAVGIISMVGLIAYSLFYGLRHLKGLKKKQFHSISYSLAVVIPIILLVAFVVPLMTGELSIVRFAALPLILLVISLYYSVIKHHLFDIRLAVVRIATYALSLVTLALVYCLIVYLVSILLFEDHFNPLAGVSLANMLMVLFLTFLFQPIKRFFDKVTNRLFYRNSYSSEELFARLNEILAYTTNIHNLLERAASEIGYTLKSEQTFFFINTRNGYHLLVGTPRHRQLSKLDAVQLEDYYGLGHKTIVASLLEHDDPIRRLLVSRRLEIVLPLIRSGKIIGFMCLGDHMTSGYTNRDIKVLSTISDSLAIAVQNALIIQEVRDLNTSLQRKIDSATKELRFSNARLRRIDKSKDEFISMASHQLRTPLTSVKGYISMILDGDVGKITEPQRKLLREAFMSSERMVRLIGDFLNVSRLQTGMFEIEPCPVDLPKLIIRELDILQSSAAAYNLKFIYKQSGNVPLIAIDQDKMRQVIMNFADNAIYYSRPGTSINVSLDVEGNYIIFKIKDTGIGVPRAEQKQLFSKFYRASNARKHRPDGTGVGLFLAKKVISAHGGQIVFESVENQGSTFGFKLPIDQLRVDHADNLGDQPNDQQDNA